MTFEVVRLIVFSVCFCLIGYIVGWMRNLWQIRQCFPDLYEEMKRRCNDCDNA